MAAVMVHTMVDVMVDLKAVAMERQTDGSLAERWESKEATTMAVMMVMLWVEPLEWQLVHLKADWMVDWMGTMKAAMMAVMMDIGWAELMDGLMGYRWECLTDVRMGRMKEHMWV